LCKQLKLAPIFQPFKKRNRKKTRLKKSQSSCRFLSLLSSWCLLTISVYQLKRYYSSGLSSSFFYTLLILPSEDYTNNLSSIIPFCTKPIKNLWFDEIFHSLPVSKWDKKADFESNIMSIIPQMSVWVELFPSLVRNRKPSHKKHFDRLNVTIRIKLAIDNNFSLGV
jgi:hypothetical protein